MAPNHLSLVGLRFSTDLVAPSVAVLYSGPVRNDESAGYLERVHTWVGIDAGTVPACALSAVSCSTESEMSVDDREPSETFGDLNLDQIVESITAAEKSTTLKPFFYAPLSDVETVRLPLRIFRDLEDQVSCRIYPLFARGNAGDARPSVSSGQIVLQISEAELVS